MVQTIGLVGLAVMGQNLVLNFEDNDFNVVVYNRTTSKTEQFMNERAQGRNIEAAYSLEELVDKLEPPRVIMLMIASGKPIDIVKDKLTPLLDEGDTIIDGGNSFYKDTERRVNELEEHGINYLGVGISGGEEGARHGPSIMPGGQETSYRHVKDIFEAAAAQAHGEPCVTYLGPRGAGHFVKMVHNGIEYAMMQAIAETYHYMRDVLNLTYDEMHQTFNKWSEGRLGGYLIEITTDILGTDDPRTGEPMAEKILDTAKHKGTGKWTSQQAYDFGVPVHNISNAVLARIISAYREHRQRGSDTFTPNGTATTVSVDELEQALYASIVLSYAQGFHLLSVASDENDYNLNLRDVAKIWRGGCIIRSKLLNPIMEAFDNGADHLAFAFSDDLNNAEPALRNVVTAAIQSGIPVPVLSQSLSYLDTYHHERIPTAAIIQSQRDYFGSHTYRRVDDNGSWHLNWTSDKSEEER
jgi:6-phosphogluconate dehydrogenase